MKITAKKIFIALIASLLAVFPLLSCASSVHYEAKDYILTINAPRDDFRILQLTDVHIGNKDNRKAQYAFLDKTISMANADMIILTGDLFTFADKATALELFGFIDGYGVPWSVTFGNHDEQCYFPITWMTGELNEFGSNCVFIDRQDDDVFGNSNYAVNLTRNGSIFGQIILLDSNRYYFGDYYGYDYIKRDQIDWYERIVKYTAEQNGGAVVPSVAFFHIPFPEFEDAWNAVETGEATLEYGERNEGTSSPKYNSGFFDKVLELGSTKACVVGHDHVNNYRIKYKGVYLCYGVNSTDRIYCKENMMGGHIVVMHTDGSLSFEHVYHKYEEAA